MAAGLATMNICTRRLSSYCRMIHAWKYKDLVKCGTVGSQRHYHQLDTLHGPIFTDKTHLFEHMQRNILYEDDFILALNKPNGVPMFARLDSDNSVSMAHLLDDLRLCYDTPDLDYVQQLSRNQSGVLLLSKNPKVKDKIQKSLRASRSRMEINHTYIMVCMGIPKFSEEEVQKLYLERTDVKGRKESVIVPYVGKKKLKTFVVKSFLVHAQVLTERTREPKASLVQLDANTGKLECLELFMTENLCPILGDHVYSNRLTTVMGHPVKLLPDMANQGPQVISDRMRHHLDIKKKHTELVPLHLHKCALIMTRFPFKNSERFEISAPLPGFFKDTVDKLNLWPSSYGDSDTDQDSNNTDGF